MIIHEDFSYINSFTKLLIKNGFGNYTVYSYNFSRYFSEKQKEDNIKEAHRLGTNTEEWKKRCDDSHYAFYEIASKMMEALGKQYTIYQYNFNDYKNYDLFFYSNRGWNKKDWFDFCELNLPEDYDKNIKLNKELKKWLIEWDSDTNNVIDCRIQYQAFIDKKKITDIVKKYINSILNKMITYEFMEGKVKWVECNNEYGFFKKGARKYYRRLSEMSLMEILIEQKVIVFDK